MQFFCVLLCVFIKTIHKSQRVRKKKLCHWLRSSLLTNRSVVWGTGGREIRVTGLQPVGITECCCHSTTADHGAMLLQGLIKSLDLYTVSANFSAQSDINCCPQWDLNTFLSCARRSCFQWLTFTSMEKLSSLFSGFSLLAVELWGAS